MFGPVNRKLNVYLCAVCRLTGAGGLNPLLNLQLPCVDGLVLGRVTVGGQVNDLGT